MISDAVGLVKIMTSSHEPEFACRDVGVAFDLCSGVNDLHFLIDVQHTN